MLIVPDQGESFTLYPMTRKGRHVNKFPSLVVPAVIILTTSGALSDETFVNTCFYLICFVVIIYSTRKGFFNSLAPGRFEWDFR